MVLFFQPRYLKKKGIVVNSQKIKDISLYIYAPTDTCSQVDKFHRRDENLDMTPRGFLRQLLVFFRPRTRIQNVLYQSCEFL